MITVVFGKRGAGKSYYAVKYILRNLKERVVITNIKINIKHENYVYMKFEDIVKKILDLRNCLVVIDEAAVYLNNREWKKFSKELFDALVLSRHYRVDYMFIAQNVSRLDVVVRELSDELIQLKRILRICLVTKYSKGVFLNEDRTDFVDQYYKLNKIPRVFVFRRRIFGLYDSFVDVLNER